MFKKIIFSLLILLTIYSTAVIGYRLFEPKDTQSTSDSQAYIEYDSLNSYLSSAANGSLTYVLFYSSQDVNSIYVSNTVLSKAETDTRINLSGIIKIVDITTLEEDGETSRLMTEWGISAYPAFALISTRDGSAAVESMLVWNENDPITASKVEEWLSETGLVD